MQWVLLNSRGEVWAKGAGRGTEDCKQAAKQAAIQISASRKEFLLAEAVPRNTSGIYLISVTGLSGFAKFYTLLVLDAMQNTVHKTPQGA